MLTQRILNTVCVVQQRKAVSQESCDFQVQNAATEQEQTQDTTYLVSVMEKGLQYPWIRSSE